MHKEDFSHELKTLANYLKLIHLVRLHFECLEELRD